MQSTPCKFTVKRAVTAAFWLAVGYLLRVVNNFVYVDFPTFAVANGVKVLFIAANYVVNHKKGPAEAGQS